MSKHIAVISSLMFLLTGVANAYVVTTTDEAAPVHWAGYPVAYRVNADPTADVGGTAESSVIDASFAAWDDAVEDTELFTNDGETDSGYDDVMCQHKALSADGTCSDQMNTVVWAESEWAEGSGSIGLTYALFLVSTGEVFEADITMNGQHHDWATDGAEEAMDVANILTHEIGHFLGLGHSSDETATMYATALPGETDKGSLAADDIEGVTYMVTLASSSEAGGGGLACSVSGRSGARNVRFMAILLGLLLPAAMRRRRA